MPPIPAGVLFPWPSTAALIPPGWVRETALDGKQVRGAAAGLDADLVSPFGSASHFHVSPSHVPIQIAHVHPITLGNSAGSVVPFQDIFDQDVASLFHTHPPVTSASRVAVNTGIAITVDPEPNDTAWVDVIWIKSDGTPSGIPPGGLALMEADSFPGGWVRAYADRYLRGAIGDGGAIGGSNEHVHDSPVHVHGQAGHPHAGVTTTGPNNTTPETQGAGVTASDPFHLHTITLFNATATNQGVTTIIAPANHEPPFKKINFIRNDNGFAELPNRAIGAWGSTEASIPTALGWFRYSALDELFPKAAASDGESGVIVGGGISHFHLASNCQPIQNPHTHAANQSAGAGVTILTLAGSDPVASAGHGHSPQAGSVTALNNAVAVTINSNASESAFPIYGKVIFVEFVAPTKMDLFDSEVRETLEDSVTKDAVGERAEETLLFVSDEKESVSEID